MFPLFLLIREYSDGSLGTNVKRKNYIKNHITHLIIYFLIYYVNIPFFFSNGIMIIKFCRNKL